MNSPIFLFIIININIVSTLFFLKPSIAHQQQYSDCPPEVRCHPNGPVVRFPFRLKNQQPLHCGSSYNPDFTLSCDPSNQNQTILLLPDTVQVSVTEIDYLRHLIHVKPPYDDDCSFSGRIQYLNLFASNSFSFLEHKIDLINLAIFSCPASINPINDPSFIYSGYKTSCLHDLTRTVYVIPSPYNPTRNSIMSCKKMFNISNVPYLIFQKQNIILQWPSEICQHCEFEERYCRFNHYNNKTTTQDSNDYECFGSTTRPGVRKKVIIALTIAGLFLLITGLVVACYVMKRKLNDDARIEKFLRDYRALKPSRYSYADIKKITNDFTDKVGQGSYGIVYKGTLSKSKNVHVAVKMLNNYVGKSTEGQDFVNEMGIMGKIHHVNILRLVGYCADGFRRALIYEFLPNGSMERYILSDAEKLSVGWKKLESIAIGIAKGIEYLHQGCEQCILHFDIKPQNVLLDCNLVPKISDFGQAKLCAKEQSVVSMTTARGTLGYIAPEVFTRNFGNVSYKSDIYSFGMLLLGIVGGKNNNRGNNVDDQIYYPEWIYNQLNVGEELRMQVMEDGDDVIIRKLAIVGLWCIQWYPTDRPTSMKLVVQMLQGDGTSLDVPPNPFAGMTRGTTRQLHLNNQLEIIAE